MSTIRDLFDRLAIVEDGRATRAESMNIPARQPKQTHHALIWHTHTNGATSSAKYNLEIRLLPDRKTLAVQCTCKDWFQNGGAYAEDGDRKTRPCKHLLAFSENCVLPPGVSSSSITDVLPLSSFSAHSTAKKSQAKGMSFGEQVSAQINSAIEALSLEIEELLEDGQVPLVIGPTGCGKSSAHRMIALRNEFSLVESAGAASYSDADMVGIVHVNGDPFPGPLADAFSAAREVGEDVLLFLDEFTRYNARAQEALMRPLLPIDAEAAKAMGIDTEVPVRVTSAPFWGTEWGPADKIRMSLACNPWGTAIDPALIRRTTPIFAGFPEDLAEIFSDKVGQAIKASWSAVRDGRWPLPIEYQALAKAESPDDVSIFRTYSYRLRAIDPAAAEGFAATLQSLGL